jgi:BirA family biotin operon repressor/biotin-[acetyl-CoA-carboxylase] ligase
MSLVLRPPIRPIESGLLPAWAGLAVLAALDPLGWGGAKAGLKWPNDVVVDGRKLCGIIMDARSAGDEIAHVVLGLGLNVNHVSGDFPSDIASSATSLRIVRGEIGDRAAILGNIIGEMERTYETALSEVGRASIAAGARRASVLIGRQVLVKGPAGSLSGIATRLDKDGALVVDSGTGTEEKVLAGDVEMVRLREEEQ